MTYILFFNTNERQIRLSYVFHVLFFPSLECVEGDFSSDGMK